MTWEEFLELYRAIVEDQPSPGLYMSGVVGDNATRDLLKESGKKITADFDTVFDGNEKGFGAHRGDFVFLDPGTIKVASLGFGGGGHVYLAGFNTPSCAGIIKSDGFFFHSGHFHPGKHEALWFMLQFTMNSCQYLIGNARQAKLNQICQLVLTLYVEGQETAIYTTDFVGLVQRCRSDKRRSRSDSIGSEKKLPQGAIEIKRPGVTRSSPMGIGSSSSQPISIGNPHTHHSSPVITNSPKQQSLLELTGCTSTALHLSNSPVLGRARWIPDDEVKRCSRCSTEFSVITRKHHCRKCGKIFCGNCSGKEKIVRLPATKSGNPEPKEGTSPVRVCDVCFAMQDFH